MVLDLQSYKFHLILQKIYNSKAAFLTLLTADNPYRLCRPHRGKPCAPEAPAHAKPARFSAGACPGNALPRNSHRHTATHTFPCDINIHHHCIFMYRRLSALYSVIIIVPSSRHNSPERCRQGVRGGQKSLGKSQPGSPGKVFSTFFPEKFACIKKSIYLCIAFKKQPCCQEP